MFQLLSSCKSGERSIVDYVKKKNAIKFSRR